MRCSDQVAPAPVQPSMATVTSDQQIRNFSKVTDNPGTELYFEEIFEHGFSGDDPLFDLRNYFYPDSDDPHVVKLSNAGCVLEVLDHVMSLEDPSYQQITQVMLLKII